MIGWLHARLLGRLTGRVRHACHDGEVVSRQGSHHTLHRAVHGQTLLRGGSRGLVVPAATPVDRGADNSRVGYAIDEAGNVQAARAKQRHGVTTVAIGRKDGQRGPRLAGVCRLDDEKLKIEKKCGGYVFLIEL